jgi:phage shock protein PspC (stress-responsive transcriptional regulator)
MKKTISITLNGMVFNIEEDAYNRLFSYLESLKNHFGTQAYGKEVVEDIESRIAEQFNGKLKDRKSEAVTLSEIEEVIKKMGSLEDLTGEQKKQTSEEPGFSSRKLYRNPDDQIIAGVASGLASYFNIDPLIPRILLAASALAGGYGILLYIILWIIVPEAQTSSQKLEMKGNAVTIANLEENRKEKTVGKEKFNFIRYFLREILYLIGRFFRVLGPLIRTIIGLFLTAISFVAAFGLIFLTTILIFNPNSPYIDPTISQIFSGGLYSLVISSAFVAVIIPILTLLMVGISFVRRKNIFTTAISVVFVVLWLAGGLTFTVLASRAAPQIQAAVRSAENQPSQSKVFEVTNFTAIQAENNQKIKISYGPEFKTIAYGREEELKNLDLLVRNKTLIINQDQRQDFQICLVCISRPIVLEIIMPELSSVEAEHASQVEISGFKNLKTLTLDAEGAAEINFDGSVVELKIDLEHASKLILTGSGSVMKIDLSNASNLEANNYIAENVTIDAEHSAHADIHVTKKLDAEASGASRINYSGNPPEKLIDETNVGKISEQ